MLVSPQLVVLLLHWQQRLYSSSLSTRSWPADLTTGRQQQSRKSCRPAWMMKAGIYLLGQSLVECCGSSDFWIWTLDHSIMNRWTAVNAWVNADQGEPTSTHLRKRLSSSSRWCLSLVLRLHSSSSDLLMSLLFSKRLMRSSSNLDRKSCQTTIVYTFSLVSLSLPIFTHSILLCFRISLSFSSCSWRL